MVVGKVGVFPSIDEAGVRPVESGRSIVVVFGECAIVKTVREVEVTGQVISASVEVRVKPGRDKLVTDVARGGRVGVQVDHAFLVTPDEEGPLFTSPGAERRRNEDFDANVDDRRGGNRGELNVGGIFK